MYLPNNDAANRTILHETRLIATNKVKYFRLFFNQQQRSSNKIN